MNTKEGNDTQIELGLNYYLKQKWKLGVTFFCLFSFITMGLQSEISGSTMLPLSRQVGTNLGQLAWIVAARSFGYMIAVVLFGILFQSLTKSHSEIVLSIGYLFPAAATAFTPYLKSLWSLNIALFFQGMLQGLSDLAINTLVTTMWKDRSTAPLNCVYLGYPVGALLSIIIVRIFSNDDRLIDSEMKLSNSTMNVKRGYFQSELVGPYSITGIFCCISSAGFALIAVREYQRKRKEVHRRHQSIRKEELNLRSKPKRLLNKGIFWKSCSPTTCGEGYFTYGFILIFTLSLFNFFFGGIEQGFTKFFISFLQSEQMNLSKKDSILSMFFYWFPMIIGRVIATFLTASWISPDQMLAISLLLCIITYLLWILFIWYIGLTWLSVFLLVTLNGFSISSLSPTIIGWIKLILNLTPIELTFLLTGNAFGGSIFGLISGYVLEHYRPKHLFTLLTFAVLSAAFLFLLSFFIQNIHSRRINQNQSIQPKEEEEEEKAVNTPLQLDPDENENI